MSPTTVAILQQEKGVLPAVKAAFERQKAGHEGYAAAVATGAPVPGGLGGEVAPGVRRQTFSSSASLAAVTKAQSRKESSRRHFEVRVWQQARHGDGEERRQVDVHPLRWACQEPPASVWGGTDRGAELRPERCVAMPPCPHTDRRSSPTH